MLKPIPPLKKNIFSFFVATLIIAGCGKQQGASRQNQAVSTYPVIEISPRSTVLHADYPATLEGHQTVEIRPRVNGYITKMYVDEGAEVQKGQKLFKLNSEEYEQQVRSANADIEAAKAAVNTAEMNLKKTMPLAEKDIVSEYEVESARYDLQSKKAALAQAKAKLVNAQTNLGYTTITSPADGVIGNIPYRVGSLVNSNISKPLTVVSDITTMYAYFSMSERELLEMMKQATGTTLRQKINQMPPVSFIMADNTLYPHKGHLEMASGLISTSTGSANFRATFSNPEKFLRSGGSGTVRIPLPKDSVIIIPKKATYDLQNRHFVFVVKNGKVKSVPVAILSISNPKTYVVTDGLDTGDQVVIDGLNDLQDGMNINPKPVDTDSVYLSLNSRSVDSN
jgi:membrane fusion protein (multidrug efflux system)